MGEGAWLNAAALAADARSTHSRFAIRGAASVSERTTRLRLSPLGLLDYVP